MRRIYLDNNATTAVSPKVLEAMMEELAGPASNPSSVHAFGQKARQKLVRARERIADVLGCLPEEVLFTSGGTEAMNTLIRWAAHQSPQGQILTSSIEHSCVELALAELAKEGWEIIALSPGEKGFIDVEQIAAATTDKTRFMVFAAVNNETGVKAPIEAIAEFAHKRDIPLLVDGVAWLGKEQVILSPGIAGIGFSAHKIHGPKGTGFALIRSRKKFSPLLVGGPQEEGRRAGTENLAGILGAAAALEEAHAALPTAGEKMLAHRQQLEEALVLLGAVINGTGLRICNTVNMSFPGLDGETLLIQLDQAGIAASHGSACSAGAMEPSRVLRHMGFPSTRVRSALRFSLSRLTTDDDIVQCIQILSSLYKNLTYGNLARHN